MSLANRGMVQLVHPTQHIWLRAWPVVLQGTRPPAAWTTNSRFVWEGEEISPWESNTKRRAHQRPDDHYALDIGWTGRGLEEVGDVTAVRRLFPTTNAAWIPGSLDTATKSGTTITPTKATAFQVKPEDILIHVEWEGHSITSADELYHTIWNTFSGETVIRSPVAGTVLETWNNDDDNMDCILEEDTVLVRMLTKVQDLERAIRNAGWINEVEYTRLLGTIPPGRFAER